MSSTPSTEHSSLAGMVGVFTVELGVRKGPKDAEERWDALGMFPRDIGGRILRTRFVCTSLLVVDSSTVLINRLSIISSIHPRYPLLATH